MKRLIGWILCNIIHDHNWTSKALEGIPPDPVKQDLFPIEYFYEYTQLYCKRCRRITRVL